MAPKFPLIKVVHCSTRLNFSKYLRKGREYPFVSSVSAFFSFPCFSLHYFRMDYLVPLLALEVPTSQEESNISFWSPSHFQDTE